MGFSLVPGSASDAQKTVVINGALQQLNNESVTKVYKDANGIPSILLGLDSQKKSVIKVAKAGQNVLEATDDQLVLNSNQNAFKIVKKVPVSLNLAYVSGSSSSYFASASVAHGLSYIPGYQAFIVIDPAISVLGVTSNENHNNPALIYGTSGGNIKVFLIAEVSVDANNVNLVVQADSSFTTGVYKFSATAYLTQETFV